MGEPEKAREMAWKWRRLAARSAPGTRDPADYVAPPTAQDALDTADLLDALADKLEGAPMPELGPNACVSLPYTNWRGETSVRRITPLRLWFGSTEWHPERQWMLTAYDEDKGAERDFALSGFAARMEPGEDVAEDAERCARYRPDLMAGGTDCASCGWPREQHSPNPAQDVAGLVERLKAVKIEVYELGSVTLGSVYRPTMAVQRDVAARDEAAATLTTLSARVREAEARLGRWAAVIERAEAMAAQDVPLDDLTLSAMAMKAAQEAEARAERLREAGQALVDFNDAPTEAKRPDGLHWLMGRLRTALDGEGA